MRNLSKTPRREACLLGLFITLTLLLFSRAAAQQKKPEVPFVPTPDEVVSEMLKMARANGADILYDLGCGDGRIVITAAKKLGCRGVGIDIDPARVEESRENAIKAGVSEKVRFVQMDLFDADIREATVVTLYLLSSVNLRLRPKLLRELNPGTRVVSHEFGMGEWEPDATSSVDIENSRNLTPDNVLFLNFEDLWKSHKVYSWIIPGNAAGSWELTIPGIPGKNKFILNLEQEFQRVRGKAWEGESPIAIVIRDEKIIGNAMRFLLVRERGARTENMHFEGQMRNNIMQGTVTIEGRPGNKKMRWTAKRVAFHIHAHPGR